MHDYYINKYIPLRYLVRYHIRVAHVVHSYFVKQSGYKSLNFLAYLVLLPPYYQAIYTLTETTNNIHFTKKIDGEQINTNKLELNKINRS